MRKDQGYRSIKKFGWAVLTGTVHRVMWRLRFTSALERPEASDGGRKLSLATKPLYQIMEMGGGYDAKMGV